MIKTSDFLFKYLVEKHGITDVFFSYGWRCDALE